MIQGGPVIVPTPHDYKYYYGYDFYDKIEEGFYDDYDPYDNIEIANSFSKMGPQESLQCLLDHAGGDFDVVGSSSINHGIIDIDGDFKIG